VSGKAILCCLVITGGYFLGIEEEGLHANLTFNGVVFGILSSCCVSLNSIYTKKVLPLVDNSAWTLTFYNNVNASLLFLPLIYLTGEFPERIIVHEIQSFHFWVLMVVGGICGVSIGFVTAMQIKLTSPLTHNISGTAKACAQTVIAVWHYNDVKPWMWWCSNWIVLIGSGLYARVQQLDMQRLYNKKNKALPVSTGDDESKEVLLGEDDEFDERNRFISSVFKSGRDVV
jgi:GDP-fucose transporter C1